jgi:GT2 family glycosyltransferase
MLRVSVVLPTYNRLLRLQRVLAGLAAQSYPLEDFEVVVVSDGSIDGTSEFLATAQYPFRLVPVLQSNQGVAAARNHGLERAGGELVVFVDDDVVPAPQLLSEHARCHDPGDPHLVVLGPMLTPPDARLAPWVAWEQAMLTKQYDDMISGRWRPTARQFYTGNTSVARADVLAAGGFDPAFRRAEDVELAYRLVARGAHFVFNPQAIGYHYAERSFKSWLDIPYVYGRNDVIFTATRGQSWLLPTVFYEFRGRNSVIRGLTRLCLDRPALTRVALASLKAAMQMGDRFSLARVTRLSCSGIFNLRHYQGIADELGGRAAFFAGAAQATTPVGPPG